MIKGYANLEGTSRYRKRHKASVHKDHFRKSYDLWLSSVGLGTYLGDMDEGTDEECYQAALECLNGSINVIDTAVNYRAQRSERVIGKAIRHLVEENKLHRDEVFVSTKAGFIPYDGEIPQNHEDYMNDTFYHAGILKPNDLAEHCHALTPEFLEYSLERSRHNLGVQTIDLFYLHNPEMQLLKYPQDQIYPVLSKAFRFLEDQVHEGKIHWYGMATWDAFRVPEIDSSYLSLEKVMGAAEIAGGKHHHMRAIQLPYNRAMLEAVTLANQTRASEEMAAIMFAAHENLMVFTSASILQGRFADLEGKKKPKLYPGCNSIAQHMLQFVRSTPGVTSALVGMKCHAHVLENIEVSKIPLLQFEDFV